MTAPAPEVNPGQTGHATQPGTAASSTSHQENRPVQAAQDLRSAALVWAAAGHPVFPCWWVVDGACACRRKGCDRPGKHPIAVIVPRGLSQASTNPNLIDQAWSECPEANPAVRCDRLVVIDNDPKNGGLESLAKIVAECGEPPASRRHLTGVKPAGRGFHLLYLQPADGSVTTTILAPGLDLRAGSGAYIMVPPSRHVSGVSYEVADGRDFAPYPAEWFDLVRAVGERLKPKPPRREPAPSVGTPRVTRPAGSPIPLNWRYADAAFRGEYERVVRAPVGERNPTLNDAAFRLGQLVAAGVCDLTGAEALLLDAAARCGLGSEEATRTIRSGLSGGMRKPRERT